MSIEKTLRVNELFDMYAPLLTEKQQEVIRYYFHEDLSYQEIAEILHISRSGVYDNIKRAVDLLEETERKLGFVKQTNTLINALNKLEDKRVDKIVNEYLKGGNYES
ncbi:signal recognition particle [Erysipelothrix larvae]|uniref:UPF0122 protein AOC36_04710 n=1 Tax=Erysipelothrix larvae TaxID=1514105 RepID=A0A109UGW0_9FIRM|nr:YlxM family DNA-binding protein [Erysipelothrix larvae]AMC93298.1 signal recognition particle [Erysipelothrix larvae]